MVQRIAKIFISFALALCALLAAVDNVIDPETNFLLVRHVMSMNTLPLQWNGQEAAFRFSMTMLAALIFLALPEREA